MFGFVIDKPTYEAFKRYLAGKELSTSESLTVYLQCRAFAKRAIEWCDKNGFGEPF